MTNLLMNIKTNTLLNILMQLILITLKIPIACKPPPGTAVTQKGEAGAE